MDAYQQLKEDILRGVLRPGERLREEQIAARLQLSRTPVREAIRRLQAEGLLISSANRGATVRTYQFEDVQDAYNLRAQIEGFGAALAAQNADAAGLEQLHEANELCKQAAELCLQEKTDDHTIAMVQANQVFHSTIIQMANNRALKSVVTSIVSLPVTFQGFYWFSPEALRESVRHHQLLEAAIARQDPEQARALMATHIYHGRDHVLKNIHKSPLSEEG